MVMETKIDGELSADLIQACSLLRTALNLSTLNLHHPVTMTHTEDKVKTPQDFGLEWDWVLLVDTCLGTREHALRIEEVAAIHGEAIQQLTPETEALRQALRGV